MSSPISGDEIHRHLAYHVFLPPKLPQSELEKTADGQVRSKIVDSTISAVRKYKENDSTNAPEWDRIIRMLEQFAQFIKTPIQKDQLTQDMCNMEMDDVLVLYIRAQNAAVLVRKKSSTTVFEAFEVQALTKDVMSITGKLVRYYPGPAVEVPNEVANDVDFVDEIANILAQMDTEEFEKAVATTHKANSKVREIRDSTNPNYFIQLFFGILRGMGQLVDPPRVAKRIADEVLWKAALKPWRRSPIWLIIRVALQTSLSSNDLYKHFMAFCHADILSVCRNQNEFSSDLLYCMRVKMGRRVFKVRDSVPEFVIEKAKTVADEVETILQSRWTNVQADQARSPEWNPSAFDFDAATRLTLPNSRAYLEKVFRGRFTLPTRSTFEPTHKPRLENVDDFTRYANGALTRAFSEDKQVALFDFEDSVYTHLSKWTSRNLKSRSAACKTVSSCFEQYLTAARSHYTIDVADQSIMILTLMKLWMAIDELTTHKIPLLRDFSPELPQNLLDPLLLRTSQQIKHARIIQQHIRSRHGRASPTNNSIFSDSATSRDFAVQYFRRSSSVQSVKTDIESTAKSEREEKLEELRKKNQRHTELCRQASQRSHEYSKQYSYYTGDWTDEHSGACERCRIERERDSMTIDLHEWPLPSDPLKAQVAVFELNRPAVFTIWRDTTYRILRDLGASDTPDQANPPATLENYTALCPWLKIPDGISARIIMASFTKSFIQSHYSGSTSIPTGQASVCVNNGLKFRLYDRWQHRWAAGPFNGVTFKQYGTLSLPQGSAYRHLRYALEGTAHTSNEVLADQYDCPEVLSLHEHIAFGTLRSGPRLQWMNIVRGIQENILTFGCQEVKLLHIQAAWQIGPLTGDGHREWHIELSMLEYGKLLVSQAKVLLDRVRANWLEVTSVSTAVMLVARLLASSLDTEVREPAYEFLRDARSVTLRWLSELKIKLAEATDESSVIDYQNRVYEMAAICRSTFDIDPDHIPRLLTTSEDFTSLIICSIILYDNKPPDVGDAPQHLQTLFSRDHRLSHRVLPYILQALLRDSQLPCPAISDLWPSYQAGPDGWIELPKPNTRWVSTITAGRRGKISQTVHLNLLEGRLLIDSKPLGRLPRDYVQHPTYIRVFGQTILDVVPADSPGMEFATRECIHNYQASRFLISFMLADDSDELVIQASKDDETFELVPFSRLTDDFPEFLSTDYHHWAHLQSKTVEFRPLSQPWSPLDRQWVLRFTTGGGAEMESEGHESALLIDIHGALFCSLAFRLSPLESSRYLHIAKYSKGRIEADLPRLRLSFFINEQMQLESSNFRGQIVDESQSTGTMFGLKNQLVLRAKDPITESLPRSRSVLIPHGKVRFEKKDHHVSVVIYPNAGRHILFHRYHIDVDLGYLASDAGLTSRLFKIYLHALTSHCLPDLLTGRTGTEEALSELSESATSSFEQLEEEQGQILHLLGLLTPNREYYPAHLHCMQATVWSALSPLSLHHAFSSATASILKRAKALEIFHSLPFKVEPLIVSPEATLLHRAAQRNSVYYSPNISDSWVPHVGNPRVSDINHLGRDTLGADWEEEGHIAAWTAGLTSQSWGRAIYVSLNLVSLAESWHRLKGSHGDLVLTYSSSWLRLDLPSCWITLYDLCRHARTNSNKFRLASCLSAATFSRKLPLDLLPAVIAFATNQAFSNLTPPPRSGFSLIDGYRPTRSRIEIIVSSHVRELDDTPAASLPRKAGESYDAAQKRRRTAYRANISDYEPQFVAEFMRQWPSSIIYTNSAIYTSWFEVDDCRNRVKRYFRSCQWNIELRTHLREVERVLSAYPSSQGLSFVHAATRPVEQPVVSQVEKDPWSAISMANMMLHRPSFDFKETNSQPNIPIPKRLGSPADTSRLSALFLEFEQSIEPLNRRYGKELNKSHEDLAKKPVVTAPSSLPLSEPLDHNRQNHHLILQGLFRQLACSLGPLTPIEGVLSTCGVWPRVTPRTLLQHLGLKSRLDLNYSGGWLNALKCYAQGFVEYQRSQRLVALAHSNNIEEFWKELELVDSHTIAEEYDPDWLLVQIDGNFSARSVQRHVAEEMMSPSSGSSTVLQLNMGEGKSSVIVPLIAASLADTKQLVRVVVLKPLWRQMFHLLVNRLSGLVNRRIYYMPFGRQIRMDPAKARQLEALYTECMREGGILLAQPEHILSFKLMGIDQLISAKPNEDEAATQLRNMQDWLTNHARDILDESDEILHVKYQLVYTVGQQQPLEDHPDRWTTTQQVLQLLARRISQLGPEQNDGFDYQLNLHGKYPTVRILPHCEKRTQEKLISALADDILMGNIQNLNFVRLTPATRKAMHRFLTSRELSYDDYESLKHSCDGTMWKGLLLIRGLLASGILVFALKEKRYRVDYGLDLGRSLLAVPFRAKDIPSLRAEFGHPDVAVVLTCLSYYSQGLTADQLDNCFDLLYKLDNPSLEYEQWVARDDQTPEDLRQLSGVNIKDREQFNNRIVPNFSCNSGVVDFFLSSVVFPKAAKEFPHKLSTSGWDLAEQKPNVTTGFSGTNDNRYLLPTSITQADPVNQLSTNALVLTYLLRPENNYYVCMRGKDGRPITTANLLGLLCQQNPEIRVLLDVGAQMLELQNEVLVRCWFQLNQSPDVKAAVYFNDKDELMVLPRNGVPCSFYSSPFAQQLDKCIVYLDDGHTRGTDLKLPRHYRALVTLGPKVTKDRLLQGCMRMRKLGHGQSVIFAAPPEVDSQIRGTSPSHPGQDDKVDALDVRRWAMLETCRDLQHHVSHWAQQGIEYARRAEAQQQYDESWEVSVLKEGWITPEARRLEEMYGALSPDSLSHLGDFTQRAFNIPDMRERLNHLGIEKLEDPSMDEEQEREVSHEVEREQQVERPPKRDPAKHSLHRDVYYFIQTGRIEKSSPGFTSLFHPFGPDAPNGWSTRVFASVDFLRTLASSEINCLSEYMRPVNWVIRGPNGIRVALSPYEVNELLPWIRKSTAVSLHIYAPRVTHTMQSFSRLDFYSIPPQPKPRQSLTLLTTQLQLDLFAGQLYLSDYHNYLALCAILGLYTLPIGSDENSDIDIEGDGFVKPEYREALVNHHPAYATSRFTSSPIPMLKELIGRRRKGMKYLRTHMGEILHARNLTQNDF